MNGHTTARPNWENRTLYHGDNLDFMRSMNSATVDLIATDPPFNKGRDFHATPESLAAGASFHDRWRWDEDVHPEWTEQMQDDWPGVWAVIDWTRLVHSDAMAAFLCYMAVRVVEMHRILRDGASIYLHCDSTAGAYLKTLMDGTFGARNAIGLGEITWKRTTAHNDHTGYGNNVDRILAYSKDGTPTFHTQHTAYDEKHLKRFRHKDPDGRRWTDGDLTAKGLQGGGYEYEYKGCRSLWRVPPATMERLDRKHRLHFTRKGGIRLKRYLDELPGRPVQALWDDIEPINSQAKERTGYPTQKPLALYQRVVRTSSNPGDIVFDPFAGCATTAVAAELEGRRWVACDLWDKAYETVKERLEAATIGRTAITQGQIVAPYEAVILLPENRQPDGRVVGPLVRTDDGETAAPTLKPLKRKASPPSMKREQMVAALIAEHGIACLGCGRTFDSARYLELDHRIPRSEGGSNELENRVLLCGPCNRTKGNTLTLTGLRKENRRMGFMAGQEVEAKPKRRGPRSAER